MFEEATSSFFLQVQIYSLNRYLTFIAGSFISFLKRVDPKQTKNFEQLFPEEERQKFVRFATQVNPKQIRQFLLEVRNHPELRE